METVEVQAKIDMAEVDELIKKVNELNKKLKEAKSLVDELASVDLELKIKA